MTLVLSSILCHILIFRRQEEIGRLCKETEQHRQRIQQLEVKYENATGELARNRALVENHQWETEKALEVSAVVLYPHLYIQKGCDTSVYCKRIG